MYPWQAAALECGEQYNNLVYCAPTSGGKSLVAEVLMIRRLLASQRDAPQPHRSKPVRLEGAPPTWQPGLAAAQILRSACSFHVQAACDAALPACSRVFMPGHLPSHPMQKYGRALVVLPYVSIVHEKSEHLADVLAPMNAAVKGFFGGEEGQALAPRCAGGPVPACLRHERKAPRPSCALRQATVKPSLAARLAHP